MISLSNRSKSRMAIAALDLSDHDVKGLDVLVRETVAHPFIGPLIGIEAENLTDFIEEVLNFLDSDEPSQVLGEVIPLLGNPKMRALIASGIISVVQQLSIEHKQTFRLLMQKISAMDIDEFQVKDGWRDEHHFISEGILPFLHATSDVEVAEQSCPHCGLFIT